MSGLERYPLAVIFVEQYICKALLGKEYGCMYYTVEISMFKRYPNSQIRKVSVLGSVRIREVSVLDGEVSV